MIIASNNLLDMNPVYKIIVTVVLGLLFVWSLYSNSSLPNRKPNGFIRAFNGINISMDRKEILPFNAREIVGITDDSIYFSTDHVNELLVADSKFANWRIDKIGISDSLIRKIKDHYSIQRDSNGVTVFAGNIPAIFKLKNGMHVYTLQLDLPAFIRAAAIGAESFVVKRIDKKRNQLLFYKTGHFNLSLIPEHELTHSSIKGLFEGDGQLLHEDGVLTYMHFYNNQVVSFDTNLTLIRHFTTIDTVNKSNLRSEGISKSGKKLITNGSPLLTINQEGCLYQNLLFVCSNLKSDNESEKDYFSHIPIDVYNVFSGEYKGSFYLPLDQGKLIKSFKIANGKIIALYHTNNVYTFNIDLSNWI